MRLLIISKITSGGNCNADLKSDLLYFRIGGEYYKSCMTAQFLTDENSFNFVYTSNTITSNLIRCYTVKGFNFAVLKVRGFLDGDLSRWFKASVTILADFGPKFNPPFRWRSKHQTKNHCAYH